MTGMALRDNIYNWIKDFFDEHHHCTKYAGVLSTEAAVTSIDQPDFIYVAALRLDKMTITYK